MCWPVVLQTAQIILGCLFQALIAHAGANAGQNERLPIDSSDEIAGSFERSQELVDCIAEFTLMVIVLSSRADLDGKHEFLAFHGVAMGTIGPSVGEHQVFPLLEQRRAAVPIDGKLPYQTVTAFDECLLARNVDLA